MNSKHKALLLTLCVVVLVVSSAFGTLAYLTDTESVQNTFTVGQVGLSLDEAKVNKQGQPLDKEGNTVKDVAAAVRTTENNATNAYHLLPGQSYTKDPTVTVDANSEESYVRMMVTVSFKEALKDATLATGLDSIFNGYDATKWPRYDKTVSTNNTTITYEYRYHTTVDGFNDEGKAEDAKLEPLFTDFTVPGDYTNEQIAVLDGMTISVEAHAIQAVGFDDAADAWAAFTK